MPRHKLTIECEVPIDNEQDGKQVIGLASQFMQALNPLATPKPTVDISPVEEIEGEGVEEKGSDLTIADKKLIVPGQNGDLSP